VGEKRAAVIQMGEEFGEVGNFERGLLETLKRSCFCLNEFCLNEFVFCEEKEKIDELIRVWDMSCAMSTN
jgi:hypothetical protein